MSERVGRSERTTAETRIETSFCLDGKGTADVSTGVPFLDHMLSLASRHGLFDLVVRAEGDLEVDHHHTVEDVGICLGRALREGLGDKRGIRRYGSATIPMVDALASVVLDISSRGYLVFDVTFARDKVGGFDVELAEEFLRAFATEGGIDLHVRLHYGDNVHHCIEAIFKALGRALDEATSLDDRIEGVLSTKGEL